VTYIYIEIYCGGALAHGETDLSLISKACILFWNATSVCPSAKGGERERERGIKGERERERGQPAIGAFIIRAPVGPPWGRDKRFYFNSSP
jgi:hypothetical protein